MTFVKTKIELAKLKEEDVLEVLLCEGEPLENIPRAAREQGYHVLDIQPTAKSSVYKIVIARYTD